MTVWVSRNLATVGYVILALATSLALFFTFKNDHDINAARRERVRQLNAINQAQCDSLRNLYGIIALTIKASDDAIDTVAYYRSHPAEAALAHASNAKALARFRRPACPPDIKLDH